MGEGWICTGARGIVIHLKEYSFTDKNLTGGTNFLYRLKQIDNDGKFDILKR